MEYKLKYGGSSLLHEELSQVYLEQASWLSVHRGWANRGDIVLTNEVLQCFIYVRLNEGLDVLFGKAAIDKDQWSYLSRLVVEALQISREAESEDAGCLV